MNIFYLCRAHQGQEPCGIYMASKLWQRTQNGKWRCGIERSTWETHFAEVPYAAVQHVDASARYRPWARGHGAVLEFRVADGAWYSMLCSLPPPLLQDSFDRLRASWRSASEQMSPENLFRAIPMVHPKGHIIPGLPLGLIGRFPFVALKQRTGRASTIRAGGALPSPCHARAPSCRRRSNAPSRRRARRSGPSPWPSGSTLLRSEAPLAPRGRVPCSAGAAAWGRDEARAAFRAPAPV